MRHRSPITEEGEDMPGREDGRYKGTESHSKKNGESLVDFWPERMHIVGRDRQECWVGT